ncbi:MAG TPA: amidohydrolase/deacetylase family metallohydrolase, partial [Bryobacteraceae bacterium]|nr:amidohydrolase/deacetylase family metallohydrolase [Bryobacteraceae bacterium]
MKTLLGLVVFWGVAVAQGQTYDLLLKGGHVIDPKSNISKPMDVAVTGTKIARVAENIPASQAKKVADVAGLYVTPGLIDIHVHVYEATPVTATAGRANSVWPDAFSFRSGVTTMVDAGTSGSANFEDFRDHVIRKAKTRILAFLNISRNGMTATGNEDKVEELDTAGVVKLAKANPDVVVGFKSAHYAGPGWASIDSAVEASRQTERPVMVDFGFITAERNLDGLLRDKLRKGDIYTHCFSGNRREVMENNQLNPAMEAGRKRGIYFDIGFGAGSFYWWVAVPAYAAKFYPDSISTDLHKGSMNGGMKDMLQSMSKILALGSSIEDVIRMSTINPALEVKHPELGSLDVGAEADVAVLRLDRGKFGLTDSAGARKMGDQMLAAELTLRKGEVVWDLNGRAAQA